jgi:hypothetical protein
MELGNEYYHVELTIAGLGGIYKIPANVAEIAGQWDEQSALDYLNTEHDKVLSTAKERFTKQYGLSTDDSSQVISYNTTSERLELNKKTDVKGDSYADDYLVHSPTIPTDPGEALVKIKEEKAKPEKSIAKIDLCLAVVVEDLIKRVEKLEQ